ncbi:hypothetical protein TNCV_165291 [Trichonephila clavipes]|nr:hypothetical protein TNCV_165291 [Trichonephila clavipes]
MCNCILPVICRISIKFLVKKSAVKTFQILTDAYGDEILSRAHVFEWHKWFSRKRDSVEDDEPAGCPPKKSTVTDLNNAEIRNMKGFPCTSMVRLLINATTLKYLKDFVKKLRKQRLELGNDGGLLHQDRSHGPICQADSNQQTHYCDGAFSSYSPDLAPCDFHYVLQFNLVSERVNINVALFSYTRAFGDGPRNFEPWSSDVDDT